MVDAKLFGLYATGTSRVVLDVRKPVSVQGAFVLKPLSDIYPDHKHPLLHRTYRQLWQEMQPHAGRITRIDLDL